MSALTVHCEAHVRCTPAEVWQYLAEAYFEHHRHWDHAIARMEKLTAGPVRVGTRGVETRRFVTRQSAQFEVTEFDRPTRFAFRNTSGPFSLDRTYTLGTDDNGTRLAFEFVMTPRGAMRLPFPLLRSTIERQVRANIARIPTLLQN